MTTQKTTLAFSEWVKITGYVLGIIFVVFGYQSATRPGGPVNSPINLSMPVVSRPVIKASSQEMIQLHQELDQVKQELAALKAIKLVEAEKHKVEPIIPQSDTSVIDWQYNESEAKALAKKLNRPLYIAFTTGGCEYCELVKQGSYSNGKVMTTLKRAFIPLWVAVTGSSAATATASEYGITKYPRGVVDDLSGSPKVFMPSADPVAFMSQIQ